MAQQAYQQNNDPIRVMIVEDHGDTVRIVRRLLEFVNDIRVVGAAPNGRQAMALAQELQPDLILMDVNLGDIDGLTVAERILARMPTRIVIMSVQSDPTYFERAMSLGIRGYLVKPFDSDRLVATIRRAVGGPEPPGVQRGRTSMPLPPQPPAALRRIISVYSPKGGVGTSVLAVNLAVALRQRTQKRVVLVDANLQGGDAHVLLNINTQSSLDDLRGTSAQGIDQESVQNAVVYHEPSGLALLRAPLQPEAAEYFNTTRDAFRAILVEVRDHFDYIVVDTDTPYSETTLTVLEMADQIVAITTLEVPTIHRISQFYRVLEATQIGGDKVALVCNRIDTYYGIKPSQIEAQLRVHFLAALPEDNKLSAYGVNQGVPFILAQKNAQLSRAIYTLADRLIAVANPNQSPRSSPRSFTGGPNSRA